ncbi:MAG: cytochrome c [Saprospiraceae bacterium]
MMNTSKFFFYLLAIAVVFSSCGNADGNDPGTEYMPDMGHSVAYESNIYTNYDYNVWDNSVVDRKEMAMPKLPVEGTIPRGYAGYTYGSKEDAAHINGTATINAKAITPNGSVPYYYEDTDAERSRAVAEILSNPFPITETGLAKGKALYEIQCGICHGNKGDGNGWLVDEKNTAAAYPAAPANFLLDTFYNSTNGRFYHAIMYGKNVMGGYADKSSYEERWNIIHYIHALMAKEKGLEYSAAANTLTNTAYDRPASMAKQMAEKISGPESPAIDTEQGSHSDGGAHDHDDHSGDHGDSH